MPKIVEEAAYGGALERIARLGLGPLLDEVRQRIEGFSLLISETPDGNSSGKLRKMIDAEFVNAGGWEIKVTGDVDWTKCKTVNGTKVCLGVEVQVSGRSDLIIIDLVHLRKAVIAGNIDVGVLIVPSEKLAKFMTDRCPSMADAKRLAKEARVEDWPLLVIAFDHDGAGPAMPKQPKRRSKTETE